MSERFFAKRLSVQLKLALELSNMGIPNPPPVDRNAAFVTCDVCDRLITFVYFRSVKTHRDLCYCCRTALINTGSRVILGQDGVKHSFLNEDVFYMGLAPRPAKGVDDAAVVTDDDELQGKTTKRLEKGVVVLPEKIKKNSPVPPASIQEPQDPAKNAPKKALPKRGRAAKSAAPKEASPTQLPAAPAEAVTADSIFASLLKEDDDEPKAAKPAPISVPKQNANVDDVPSSSASSSDDSSISEASSDNHRRRVKGKKVTKKAQKKGKVASAAKKSKKKAPTEPIKVESVKPAKIKAVPPKPQVSKLSGQRGGSAAGQADDDVLVLLSQRQGTGDGIDETTVAERKSSPSRSVRKGKTVQPQPVPAAAPDDETTKLKAMLAEMQAKLSQYETNQHATAAASTAANPTSDNACADEPAIASLVKAKRPRTEGGHTLPLMTDEEVLKSPVRDFFAALRSRYSQSTAQNIDVRPPQALIVAGEGGVGLTVQEGSAIAFKNAFVGLTRCKSVVVSRLVPSFDAEGIWISVLREDDYHVQLESWHVPRTGVTLEAPVLRHSAGVGAQGSIKSMDWVPIPLHTSEEGSNTLGVCTLLRETMIVSVCIPRVISFPDLRYSVELCGAHNHQRERERFALPPAEIKWFTTGKSLEESYLLLVYKCSGVIVYQPTSNENGKLGLTARAVIPAPTEGVPPKPLPSFLLSPPCALFLDGTSIVLAIARGAALETRAAPDFTSLLFKSSTGDLANISALCPTRSGNGGLVVGYAHDCTIHRQKRSGGDETITSLALPPADVFECSNKTDLAVMTSAGDCVVIRQKHKIVEVHSSLKLTRITTPYTPSSSAGGLPRAKLVLAQDFDATQKPNDDDSGESKSLLSPAARTGNAHCRIAHAPGGFAGKNSNMSLAYFPDGAWVLFPLVF